jgi:hypothetical protein
VGQSSLDASVSEIAHYGTPSRDRVVRITTVLAL